MAMSATHCVMKILLYLTCCILTLELATSTASGQANYLFRNVYRSEGLDAPVFDAQGVRLSGTDYLAELWGGATPDSLAPAAVFDQQGRREIVPFTFVEPGYFSSQEALLVIPTVAPRGYAWLQVRAWDARLGATHEDVAALGMGGYGESPLFYAQGGDPFDQFPTPGRLIGLQSFSLRPVPEPATWGLLAIGGLSIVFVMRKRCGP
jgi:PEP-CTERM motif